MKNISCLKLPKTRKKKESMVTMANDSVNACSSIIIEERKNEAVLTSLRWMVENRELMRSKANFIASVMRNDLNIEMEFVKPIFVNIGPELTANSNNNGVFGISTFLGVNMRDPPSKRVASGILSRIANARDEGQHYCLSFKDSSSTNVFGTRFAVGIMNQNGRNRPNDRNIYGVYLRGKEPRLSIFIAETLSISRCLTGFYSLIDSSFFKELRDRCNSQSLPKIEKINKVFFGRLSSMEGWLRKEKQKRIKVALIEGSDLSESKYGVNCGHNGYDPGDLIAQFTEENSTVYIHEHGGQFVVTSVVSKSGQRSARNLETDCVVRFVHYQRFCEEFIRRFSVEIMAMNV